MSVPVKKKRRDLVPGDLWDKTDSDSSRFAVNSEHGSHAEKQKLSRMQSGYLLRTGSHYLLLICSDRESRR